MAVVMPRGGGLISMSGGGRPGGSGRPACLPTMVTPPIPNSIQFYEEFVNPSVLAPLGQVGTIATPATATHRYAIGANEWSVKQVGGTDGKFYQADPAAEGVYALASPTTSNAKTYLWLGGHEAGGTYVPAFLKLGNYDAVWMWRVKYDGILPTSVRGFGLTDSVALDADWIADPDTTLNTYPSLVITRHAAAYSGDAAGDMVLREYTGSGVGPSTVIRPAASVTTNWMKVEFAYSGTTGIISVYLDGVLVGASANSLKDFSYSLSTGTMTTTAASRQIALDTIYGEVGVGPR
mgnify:CR=1 FL=1